MKVKQGEAVKAYIVIEKIKDYQMPIKSAYEVYKLKKSLFPAFEFQREEEMKYLDKTDGKVNDDGTIHFNTVDDANSFLEMQKEIYNQEMDIEFEPISLPQNIELSVRQIEDLSSFIK